MHENRGGFPHRVYFKRVQTNFTERKNSCHSQHILRGAVKSGLRFQHRWRYFDLGSQFFGSVFHKSKTTTSDRVHLTAKKFLRQRLLENYTHSARVRTSIPGSEDPSTFLLNQIYKFEPYLTIFLEIVKQSG